MAVMCVAGAAPDTIRIVATTPIEHLSLLDPMRSLSEKGFKVQMIHVDRTGRVDFEHIKQLVTPQTLLVSVIYGSNEIGTIEPIAKIGNYIREFRRKHNSPYPLFHTDACQAAEYLDMNVQHLGVDLLSFNSSKIYGPRGVGALYVRQGTPIVPWIRGGHQEQGIRAGTENVPGIAGFARAVGLIHHARIRRMRALRDYFITKVQKQLPDIKINGPLGEERLPNNVHIAVSGMGSEHLLLELDQRGVAVGKGSACTAHSVEPSHVLRAIGVRAPYLGGALRFSFGRATTKKDIDTALDALNASLSTLRNRYGANPRTLKK